MTDGATTFRDAVSQARRSGAWEACLAAIPYARWLGLSLVRPVETAGAVAVLPAAPGGTVAAPLVRLAASEQNVGNASLPALHGGTLGALLESCAIFALVYSAESTVLPRTITITVDYLRPARPVDTFAAATIVRQGRRVATVRAEAWQDDRARPVALATAHFLVLTEDER